MMINTEKKESDSENSEELSESTEQEIEDMDMQVPLKKGNENELDEN